MVDVFPRRNLPPLAEQWGREVENRVVSAESDIEALQQGLSGQNRNAASSLSVIAQQLDAIQQTQAELANQQAELANQQGQILATTNFLLTQTVSDSKSTLSQEITSGTGWMGFNSTYDCSVSVTTGPAGRLLIQGSATLLSSGLTSILGIEIVGVTGPTFPGPYSTYVSTLSSASSGVSRSVVASLSANTTYTVRLRRGWSGGSGTAMWRDQTLVVTRS
jgi:hypothetical protein